MPKTEQEINAEKALKPRPDLIPGLALQQCLSAKGVDWGQRVTQVLGPEGPNAERCQMLYQWSQARVNADPWANLIPMGQVMAYGYHKHGHATWRHAGTEQADPETHWASACRHLCEYLADRHATESGSGLPVLWHAMVQCVITMDLLLDPPS